jgi:plastocyanin
MLAFAVSAPVASTAVSGPTINIDNFTFGPMEITVPAGATVTWINGDDVPHTVRAVDGSFHSKPLDTGDRYSVTFTGPGEYDYYCSIHPRMTAKVIVK